jgi:cytochrome oxidase Cu insertion factor (SCO1/SenC/PrrC family)
MSGMYGRSLDLTNFIVVTLFHHTVFVTSVLWIAGVASVFLIALLISRRIFTFNAAPGVGDEPRARTYLRWAFGLIWLIDGILQFQPSMPLGLADNVVRPMTVGTPSWLHSLMIHFINTWNSHPVSLAAGVAWFQVGLGLVILVSNGRTGRWVAGLSALWAGFIWLVGNGAGGIFVHGATILFGWPGATLFYVVAGAWLFVNPTRFQNSFSTFTIRFFSMLFVVAIVFQSLPAAGFWHGGNSNALTTMTSSMTGVAQPHALAWVVRHSGTIAGQMGGGFNVVVILWLAVCAVGLWMSVTKRWNWPVYSAAIGCVVFWVIGEDGAFFGGLSTDFNSLIPMAVLVGCAAPRLQSLAPRTRHVSKEMVNSAGAVVATFASAMILTSAVAMSWASLAGAETTLFLAQNGPASAANSPAVGFHLTDQFDKPYSLGEHPGRVTLLTFLDPVCWTDCPLLGRQLAVLRSELSSNAKLDIVAVAANPYHETLANIRHFIAIHGMEHVKNFYFVTGKRAQTSPIWSDYGIGVSATPSDVMSIHSDFMFIVSPRGYIKWIIPDDPLATVSLTASAVSELKDLLATQGIH